MPESIKKKLFALAREQRQLSQSLYAPSTRAINSSDDPIRAEIARLMANFYGTVGSGGCIDCAYGELIAAAKNAARQYNDRQKRLYASHDAAAWTTGLAGYYSDDEAGTKCRHALLMAQAITGR